MSTLTPSRYYARVFGLITAAVLGFLLIRLLSPFFAPLMWASLMAFMLQPANNRLLLRGQKPGLAAGLLTGAAFLVVAGPLTLFLFAFHGLVGLFHQLLQLVGGRRRQLAGIGDRELDAKVVRGLGRGRSGVAVGSVRQCGGAHAQ